MKTTALATTTKAASAIAPPANKTDILNAMAQLLIEERQKEWEEFQKRRNDLDEALKHEAEKTARKHIRFDQLYGNNNKVVFRVDSPRFRALLEQKSKLRMPLKTRDFAGCLAEVKKNVASQRITALMSNPEVRNQLTAALTSVGLVRPVIDA